jgi:hypothetical protein
MPTMSKVKRGDGVMIVTNDVRYIFMSGIFLKNYEVTEFSTKKTADKRRYN